MLLFISENLWYGSQVNTVFGIIQGACSSAFCEQSPIYIKYKDWFDLFLLS